MKKEPWQQIGERLYAEWRSTAEQARKRLLKAPQKYDEGSEFGNALIAFFKADAWPMIEYLEHNRLTMEQQSDLAHALRVRAVQKQRASRIGRPPSMAVRLAANLAMRLYRQWKVGNTASDISNYGLADKMKDQCCAYAVEFVFPPREQEAKQTVVRNLIDKPLNRRRTISAKTKPTSGT